VGAPDLTFWLEIGVGWTRDVRDLTPLSYAVLTEDHFAFVNGHQHTYENYHWVPSEGQWVNYYHGRMPNAGALVRMKHHVHMNLLLHKAFFLAASAEELGLDARPLGPNGQPMGAKEVPGAFFSHGGRLGKLFDSTTIDAALNTWPVGVVAVERFGVPTLDAFAVRRSGSLAPTRTARPLGYVRRHVLASARSGEPHAFRRASSAQAELLDRARALPAGRATVKCSLERGLVDVDGFRWDRAGAST